MYACAYCVCMFMCVIVGAHVPWHPCRSQRATQDVGPHLLSCFRQDLLLFATSEARVVFTFLGGLLTVGALGVQMQATVFDFVWVLVIQTQAIILQYQVHHTLNPSFSFFNFSASSLSELPKLLWILENTCYCLL